MFEEIASLLFQTFSGGGPDVNQQIQYAEQQLNSFGGSPEFCEIIFKIIESDEISQQIKYAAVIYLYKMIDAHWNEMIDQSKMIILKTLPNTLLKSTSRFSYQLFKKLSIILVRNTFFSGEWPELSQIIASGFSNNAQNDGDRYLLTSLLLSNAVSLMFKQVPDQHKQVYDELSTQFLLLFTEFISHSQSLFLVSICFRIACHFSLSQVPPFFINNPNAFKVWCAKAQLISEPNDDPDFITFALSAIKFLSEYFYRYKDRDFVSEISIDAMNAVISYCGSSPPYKVLGKCAYFIKLCLDNPVTLQSISADFESFTKYVILPFYLLTDEDINNAINNPSEFVNNFHTHCVDNSDPRSVLSSALIFHVMVIPEMKNIFTSLLFSNMHNTSPEFGKIIYSLCYLFSFTANKVDQSISNMLAPLLQSDSFIVRCGGLLALKNMHVSIEIITLTFDLLQDSYILVRYYAAIALSYFLSLLSNQPENTSFIQNKYASHVLEILQIYFQLTQEFNDYDLFDLIREYIKLFGPILIEIAPSFVGETYKTFLHCASLNLNYQSNLILSSISRFLEMIPSQNEVLTQSIVFLLNEIYGSLTHSGLVHNKSAIKSLVETVSNIIAISPVITDLHWQIFNIFPHFYNLALEEICLAYRNLIIKDIQNVQKPEIFLNLLNIASNLLNLQIDISESGPILGYISTLLVAASISGFPNPEIISCCSNDFYHQITAIVLKGLTIARISSFCSTLFAALLIFNSNIILNIIQNERSQIIITWADSFSYVTHLILLNVLNKCHSVFTTDELIYLLIKALKILNNLSLDNTIFSGNEALSEFSEYVRVTELSLFNDIQVLKDFHNLICNFNQEIIQAVQSQFELPLTGIISNFALTLSTE